jgi:hypothetical protein
MQIAVTSSLILAAFAVACADPRRGSVDVAPAEPTSRVEPLEAPRPQSPTGVPSNAPVTPPPGDVMPPVVAATGPLSPNGALSAGAPQAHTEPRREPLAPAAETIATDRDNALIAELSAADGTPLPQTRERPRSESIGLRLRLDALVDAIAQDDPARALPAFFPRSAYEQVKAIAEPGRDWQQRLVRAFERDIHEYHRLLGPEAASARLAGLIINERAVRWMDPGAEGNRLGYYRVTRSRLRLRFVRGDERELELTSLISWRGAWYVVHLHGFS